MKTLKLFFCLLFFISCKNSENKKPDSTTHSNQVSIGYAKGFSIQQFQGFSLLKVTNPWPKSDKDFIYLLAEKGAEIPPDLEFDQKIQVPVKKIVVTSTTHIPALEALEEENTLQGFPGLDYISSQKTRQRIKEGKIKELGKNENINTEILLNLNPEVVIAFAINGNNKTYTTIEKMGIPVVFNGDWTEEEPLGKAEWIKFFGAFYNKTEEASKIFDTIEQSYKDALKLAKSAQEKPSVFGGSMFKDQWFMPYGNSWQAQFIADAHANYLYSSTKGNGSMALPFEKVLDQAHNADFWISTGQFSSYQDLKDNSPHYNQFKAVQQKNVYSVSRVKGETGGILYFELGPQRPDLILKDLISIFHPHLLKEYTPTFFKPLKD